MIATLEAETQKKKAKRAKKPGNRSRFKYHRRGWSHFAYELDGALYTLAAPAAVVGAARRALARVAGGEAIE